MADNPDSAQGFFPPGYVFGSTAKGRPGTAGKGQTAPKVGTTDSAAARKEAERAATSGPGSTSDPSSSYTPPAMPNWHPGDQPYDPMADPQNVLGVGVKGGLDPTGQMYGRLTTQQQQIASSQVRSLLAQGYTLDYARNWFNQYASDPNKFAQQQQGLGSVYSSQNLNEYTKNFLIPFVDHVNSMVQGDLKGWGSAINQIMAGGGLQGSQIAKDLSPNSTETALYQTLAPLLGQQVLTKNYTDMVNRAIGADQTAGARIEAQNSMYQNLVANGQIPGVAGTSSLGAATTPTQGVAGLLPNAAGTNATASTLPANANSLNSIQQLMQGANPQVPQITQ